MAYDPNSNNTRPDLRTTPVSRRGSGWMAWVAILAVVIVGAFVWSQVGSSSTDPTTTSSTTPPAASDQSAAPAPATPAAPPATSGAPASPSTGGNTTKP